MSLSKVLFSFEGRAPRLTYWILQLAFGAVYIVASVIDVATQDSGDSSYGFGCVTAIVTLLFIVPLLAVGVKRCHDRNHSGWFLLLGLIPFVGSLVLFIDLGCLRGTVGDNRFGPDPLAPAPMVTPSLPLQP